MVSKNGGSSDSYAGTVDEGVVARASLHYPGVWRKVVGNPYISTYHGVVSYGDATENRGV